MQKSFQLQWGIARPLTRGPAPGPRWGLRRKVSNKSLVENAKIPKDGLSIKEECLANMK